jgi:hypothetical protein
VSLHGPPRLHFEPPQLLNFDIDPAVHSDADPHLASKVMADPDPEHWPYIAALIEPQKILML